MVSPSSPSHLRQPQNHSAGLLHTLVPSSSVQNAVEIADEVSEIGEQGAQIDFRANRRDDKRRKKSRRRQRKPQPLARHRAAIGRVENGQLRAWKDGYG